MGVDLVPGKRASHLRSTASALRGAVASPSLPGQWAERLAGQGCAVPRGDLLWPRVSYTRARRWQDFSFAVRWRRRSVVLLWGLAWTLCLSEEELGVCVVVAWACG